MVLFRCLICRVENQLKVYETLLFSVSNKQKNASENISEEDEETTYQSTSKGLWKMSQKEFLLTSKFVVEIFIQTHIFLYINYNCRVISIWAGKNYKCKLFKRCS